MTESKAAVAEEDDFPPLDIKCTDTDCGNNLHCFLRHHQSPHPPGTCRECGASLVDWQRVHKRDPLDAAHTFKMLQYEMIRHHNWHTPIDQKAVNHARRKGRSGMRAAAESMIRKKVAPAQPQYDGRQTPKSGNVIYYAQHAVACCCRKCIEEWHNIPMGKALTEEQAGYLTELVCLYINKRLPQLTENGEKVPPIRKKLKPKG